MPRMQQPINIPLDSFSYQNQSDVIKVPNSWLGDSRCPVCGYSLRSSPRVCFCDARLVRNRLVPTPSPRNSLKRKRKKKALVESRLKPLSIRRRIYQESKAQQRHSSDSWFRQDSTGSNIGVPVDSLDSGVVSGRSINGSHRRLNWFRRDDSGTSFQRQDSKESADINWMSTSFASTNSLTSSKSLKHAGPVVVRHSKWNQDAKKGSFLQWIDPKCRTVYDAFRRGAKISNNRDCIGWRSPGPLNPYNWLTYDETLLRAQNFGSGLINMGLRPGAETLVGIFAKNCVEWLIYEQALYSYSMVVVPLFDQLSPEAIAYILNETEMTTLIVEDNSTTKQILECQPRRLRVIVTIRDIRPSTLEVAARMGIQVVRFTEVEKFGAANQNTEVAPSPSNPAIICFNQVAAFGDSSVAGRPKGVILSHENIISCTSACIVQLGEFAPNKDDVMISFLPMAHMLERCTQVSVLMQGGAIGFYSGNIRNITEDMKALRPTILPAVPRFLNRMYDKVVNTVNSSGLKRSLFNLGLKRKAKEMNVGIVRNDTLWDKLLFRKVKDMIGGRVRLMVVGSAPLAGNVLTFMRAALGCVIVEGYGQTECTACCSLSVPGDAIPGHVGPPIPCNAIKLTDVPEMEYYSAMSQGEICIRGSNVFIGYYKDPEKTRFVIDDEGWLHTGDIGQWMPNGTLKIIDRKKLIFKLDMGEYIDPEKIEKMFLTSQYIAQAYVYGESIKSCVIAVIVPAYDALKTWAQNVGHVPSHSFSSLCNNSRVKKLVLEEIERIGTERNLKHFEQVRDVYLHPDLFSEQNGLLNSLGKLKRNTLAKYFKPQLEEMYETLD